MSGLLHHVLLRQALQRWASIFQLHYLHLPLQCLALGPMPSNVVEDFPEKFSQFCCHKICKFRETSKGFIAQIPLIFYVFLKKWHKFAIYRSVSNS
jgi:hypothetical protein